MRNVSHVPFSKNLRQWVHQRIIRCCKRRCSPIHFCCRCLISFFYYSVRKQMDEIPAHPPQTGNSNRNLQRNAINVYEAANACHRTKILIQEIKATPKTILLPRRHSTLRVGPNTPVVCLESSMPLESDQVLTRSTRYSRNDCATMERVEQTNYLSFAVFIPSVVQIKSRHCWCFTSV